MTNHTEEFKKTNSGSGGLPTLLLPARTVASITFGQKLSQLTGKACITRSALAVDIRKLNLERTNMPFDNFTDDDFKEFSREINRPRTGVNFEKLGESLRKAANAADKIIIAVRKSIQRLWTRILRAYLGRHEAGGIL